MFPAWRLQLREARLAMADGRWDEAAEMLASDSLREFLPAKRLSQQLAGQLVERAQQRIDNGQSTAGWRDLDQAARLGVASAAVGGVRDHQADRRLRHAVELLARGDVSAARQALDRMDTRRLGGDERRRWSMVVQHVETSELRAKKGDFASAIASIEQARRLLPADSGGVDRFLEQGAAALRETASRIHSLDSQLHAALAARQWTEVLSTAESLLELAPQHSAARQARHKAWQAVGMEVTMPYRSSPARNLQWPWRRGNHAPQFAASTLQHARNGKADTVTNDRTPGKRLVAWIDEVGAFLVCLGEETVLGQPSAEGGVDVPILADLSRRHAVIRREREAYVLTPIHPTMVDGRTVAEPTVLRDKSIIKLGDAVQLRFRRPHALSATAVLELASRHRTEPAVDGIVLMSESCIFGPQSHSHVRCRNWKEDLVLFRRGDELMCRTQTPLEIDGQACLGQSVVPPNCRIEGDEFALSLEEI